VTLSDDMNQNALDLFDENGIFTPENIRKYNLDDLGSEYKVNLEFLEGELKELDNGVRKYKTQKNLYRKGQKLDAVIDLNYIEFENGYRQITDYQITLDEETDKDKGERIQAVAHENVHRMMYPHDPEAKVEFLTGKYLKDLSENSEDEGVRNIAKEGYKTWLKRQASNKHLMTDLYKTRKNPADYDIRFQKGSGKDTSDIVTDIAFDAAKTGENIVKWGFNNIFGSIAKNYAGVNIDIAKETSPVEYARTKKYELKQSLDTPAPAPAKETPVPKPAKKDKAKSN
jgi:hypothetical protein